MKSYKSRRQLLKGVMGLTLAPMLVPAMSHSLLAASQSGIEAVSDKISVVSDVGSNAVIFAGADGNILVDSGNERSVSKLLEHLQNLSGTEDVSFLLNTHYHKDQTGGNEVIGQGGTNIIAHKRTREWMTTSHWVFETQSYEGGRSEASLPTETFNLNGSLFLTDEVIDYGYLIMAHTSGDIYVKFQNSNVLVVGDVASPERDPVLEHATGGWIGGRVEAMDLLLTQCDDATVIVPSYGPLMTKAQLQSERDMMSVISDKTIELVRNGFGPQEMLDDGFMGNLTRTFDDPYAFLYDVCKGLWGHQNKLSPNVV